MKILLSVILLIFWLLIVPFCQGLLPARLMGKKDVFPGVVLILGYLVEFVSFELWTIPFVLFTEGENFPYVKWGYLVIALLLAIAGVLVAWKGNLIGTPLEKKPGGGYRLRYEYRLPGNPYLWILVAAALLFLLFMSVRMAFFNGDDSYYVVQSLIAQQSGTMYTRSPYQGYSTPIDMRHAMAVFTMWIAYIASVTQVHATILCHTVLPLVLIPLCLLVELQIGQRLLRGREDMLPYFMFFMELMLIFGNISIYSAEAFLITRTWQGKALVGSFLFPVLIWGLLILYDEDEEKKDPGVWILLLLGDALAGLFSSLAVLLCSMLILGSGFYICLREKHLKTLIRSCFVCVPGGIYVVIYYLAPYLFVR